MKAKENMKFMLKFDCVNLDTGKRHQSTETPLHVLHRFSFIILIKSLS